MQTCPDIPIDLPIPGLPRLRLPQRMPCYSHMLARGDLAAIHLVATGSGRATRTTIRRYIPTCRRDIFLPTLHRDTYHLPLRRALLRTTATCLACRTDNQAGTRHWRTRHTHIVYGATVHASASARCAVRIVGHHRTDEWLISDASFRKMEKKWINLHDGGGRHLQREEEVGKLSRRKKRRKNRCGWGRRQLRAYQDSDKTSFSISHLCVFSFPNRAFVHLMPLFFCLRYSYLYILRREEGRKGEIRKREGGYQCALSNT